MLKCDSTLTGHEERVWCVQWDSKGEKLASSSADKTVHLWQHKPSPPSDLWSCSEVVRYGHQRSIRCVAFSPCHRYMLTGSFDGTVILWIYKDDEWEQFQTLEGHENEVKCVAWSPSGQFVATCSRDKSVWLWEVDEDDDLQCCSIMQNHTADVKMVVWHPSLDILASCSYDHSIRFYAYDSEEDWVVTSALPDAHLNTVWAIAFNHDGTHLVSVGADAILKVWKVHSDMEKGPLERDTWHCVCSLPPSTHMNDAIYTVDWCPTLNVIATGALDGHIRVFNVAATTSTFDCTLACEVLNAHDDDVNSVRWNRQHAGRLASGGDDCQVKVWTFTM